MERFGHAGDFGVVADQKGEALGAAWWRHFTMDSPGYGFVDEATPEIAIAVLPAHRRRGICTALLDELKHQARSHRIKRLSLSVERDNPAAALYRRLGFQHVDQDRNAVTMVIEPDNRYGSSRERQLSPG